jgi:hypothetical protein
MRNTLYFLSLVAIISAFGCKKEVDIPREIRPSDFYARGTVQVPGDTLHELLVRGEQSIFLDSIGNMAFNITIRQHCEYGISLDSNKFIVGGLSYDFLFGWAAAIRLFRDQKVTSTEQNPEWRREELEELLVPGREFSFGDGPGQALLFLSQWKPEITVGGDNQKPLPDAFLRLESVEDYGSPEAGIPFYGKMARFRFGGSFEREGNIQKVTNGEAVFFFRYFNY